MNVEGDLCILGSGIAGMLLAERALGYGRQVLMIERGTRLMFEDRKQRNSHDDPLPFNRSPHFSPHEPQPIGPRTRGREYVFHPVYNLGGSTNHFYGNMPRMHPTHFGQAAFGGANRTWPISYAEIEPYYLQAEQRLQISGSADRTPFQGRFAYPLPPHRLSPSDRACAAIFGAQHVVPVPTVRPSRAVDGRPKCCATNVCSLCPVDSKGTALNTVYPSIQNRIDLRSGLLAIAVEARAGVVTSVTATDEKGARHRISARQFVVACNGVDSCLLLQRSPAVPRHSSLGRYYMDHPVFDLAIHGAGFDAKPGYGDSAQTAMFTPFFAQLAADVPVSLLGEVRCSTLANEAGEGNRDVILREVVRQSLRDGSRASLRDKFRAAWGATLDLWFQVETQPLATNTVSIRRIEPDGQAVPDIRLQYPAYLGECLERVTGYIHRHLPGATIVHHSTYPGSHHWLGATRMADSPDQGCVDSTLRYHDLQNLYVLSTSTFPSSSSANPTLTLAALALRLGDHLKPASAGPRG